jgi:hypothetical protein
MTLSNEDIGAIDRICPINGSGPDVRAKVAKQFRITESFAGSIATALGEKRRNIKESRDTSGRFTESGETSGTSAPTTTGNVHKQYLASRLAAEVNAAEAKIATDGGSLASLTTQQLEALTARDFG